MKIQLPKSSGMLPTDHHRAIKNHRLMQWAKVATFGLYIVAVFMLYVSDVWGIASFVEKNSNEYIALAIFSFISFVLAFFLASSKEAVYEDIAIHRSEGWKLKPSQYAAMGLFLSSGILFEMFSTTNNQQHIANTAAEQSSMMQSIQGTNVSLIGGATLADSFASAQMKLAQCEERLKQGKEKHCEGSKARVDAVRESMAMSNQLATTAAKATMDNKVEGMLKIREHFDKPMFQAIGKATGTDNNSGMLMVVGLLIFVFELQHIMALFAYANALARINRKAGHNQQGTEYVSPAPLGVSGNEYAPTSAFTGMANSARQTVGEYAEKVEAGLKASPEVIATEYSRAQTARENVYQVAADKLDGLNKPSAPVKTFRESLRDGDKIVSIGALDEPVITYPTRQANQMSVADTVKQIQASVKASGANSPAAIQAAVFDAYAGMANPAPLNDVILERMAEKLVEKSVPAQPEQHAQTRPSTVPAQSLQARTDAQSEQHAQPANTVPAQSEQPVMVELTGSAKQAETDLYPAWLDAVQSKEMTAGARDAKRFISQATKNGADEYGLTIQEMGRIWLNWQDRAARDGVLTANPKYQPGNRQAKYLLVA
ncbi:hypothetical protein J9253_15480 [Thiothrix litoralis]|uniref:Uncharacterized protein n=1 Tax=Thiothrix litoralis TaxID=2891210 RepID=A0ABX7WP47_9GAMM|nr:hypothetical protein [Thiothrix litoralis]QTR45394.1 hypothetical protein J9253_15480 [Thiothrix litoralis]